MHTVAKEAGAAIGRLAVVFTAACLAAGPLLSAGCGDASDDGAGANEAAGTASETGEAGQEDRTGAANAGGQAGAGAQESTGASALSVDPRTGRLVRTARVRVGGVPVTVEIADTPELRQAGLMNRDSLPVDHGMLFVYPEEQPLQFWMRNTEIPLGIAFISAEGTILAIARMEPQSDSLTRSGHPAMYALEMEAGWFAEHGVEAGERVEF